MNPVMNPVNAALVAFLKTMFAESRKRYPNRHLTEHTVPQFDQLTIADRQVLQRSMSAALSAAASAAKAIKETEYDDAQSETPACTPVSV